MNGGILLPGIIQVSIWPFKALYGYKLPTLALGPYQQGSNDAVADHIGERRRVDAAFKKLNRGWWNSMLIKREVKGSYLKLKSSRQTSMGMRKNS